MLFSSRLSSRRYDSHSSKSETKMVYYYYDESLGAQRQIRMEEKLLRRQVASQETIRKARKIRNSTKQQPTFAALVHVL